MDNSRQVIMEQYIPKSALVAEIESRIKSLEECFNGKFPMSQSVKETEQDKGKLVAYKSILSFLDTLEAKEVDLKEHYHKFLQKEWFENSHVRTVSEMMAFTAKHFFELGLNASNPLTWEDVKEICVQSVLVEIDLGGKVSDERHYTEVLKRFKAHKGDKV